MKWEESFFFLFFFPGSCLYSCSCFRKEDFFFENLNILREFAAGNIFLQSLSLNVEGWCVFSMCYKTVQGAKRVRLLD